MTESSRRINVEIVEDAPQTRDEFAADHPGWDGDDIAAAYDRYLHYFQPFRWHAKGMNNRIVAHGERYRNRVDVEDAVELLFGKDTTVTVQLAQCGPRLPVRYGETDLSRRGRPE